MNNEQEQVDLTRLDGNRPLRKRNETPKDYGDGLRVSEGESYTQAKSARAAKYADEYGDPTYYFLNISQGKVVITDLAATIEPAVPVDMLDLADEDQLLKSKDFRQATRPRGGEEPLLQRLTPEEFDKEYSDYHDTQRLIAKSKDERAQTLDKAAKNPKEFKMLSSQDSDSELDIRPNIETLVNKLRIGTNQVNNREAEQIARDKVAGISAQEFILKFKTLKPSSDEIDYVYQTVKSKEVRSKLKELYPIEEEA